MARRRTTEERDAPEDDIEVDQSGSEEGAEEPSSPKRARVDEFRVQEGVTDKELEDVHRSQIDEAKREKYGKSGAIAELGIIQQVDLVNFLCHRNLTVKLIPQINFVTGHNGSGKSAILTAIAVALGGKATSTGRGTGLKSFIKEGENAAEVTIRIKNEGPDAIDPQIYGKSIIITRHFTSNGTSGFKIKSSLNPAKNGEGRTVATTKAELQRITDAMNIQVDNPLNVLTQDLSRKFISGSSPAEKYEFFLKGTQLQQLSEDYQQVLESIDSTRAVLNQKANAMPELRQRYQEALLRFKQAENVVAQQNELDTLKRELAWAYVAEKQKELEKSINTTEAAQRRVNKIEEKLRALQGKITSIQLEIQETEIEIEERKASRAPQRDALFEERRGLLEKRKELDSERSDLKRDERRLNDKISAAESEIRQLKTRIRSEEEKIRQSTGGARQADENRLVTLQAEHASAMEAMRTAESRANEAEEEATTKNKESEAKAADFQKVYNELGTLKAQATDLEKGLANKWTAYGNNIPRVLKQIEAAQWRGKKPIGPLGDYVELVQKDWIVPVKLSIGGAMSSWLVENNDDQKQLRGILTNNQNPNPSITVSRFDVFNFSHGEPAPQVPTIYRVLKIRDPLVACALVNLAGIENIALAPDLDGADDLLKNYEIRGKVYTKDKLSVQSYSGGGGLTVNLGEPRCHASLFAGSVSEARAMLDDIRQKTSQLSAEVDQLNRDKVDLQRQAEAAARIPQRLRNEKDQHRRRMNELTSRIEALRTTLQTSAPAEVGALQSAVTEQETEVAALQANREQVQQRLNLIAEELAPTTNSIEAIGRKMHDLDQGDAEKTQMAADLAVQLAENQHAVQGYTQQLTDAKAKHLQEDRARELLETEFVEWTERAVDKYSPRLENPRPVPKVKSENDKLQSSITRAEKVLGASTDQLARAVTDTKEIYDHAKKEVNDMKNLVKTLSEGMNIRMLKWHQFRRHISIRAKLLFFQHLANRGFEGKISINHPGEPIGSDPAVVHEFGTLNIKIWTDAQTDEKGNRRRAKDTKSLSGGEKSFSTLCLLLALWDAIGCPIRCLDEFDVFMDEINRVVAMKMMIDAAKSSDMRQFILITPLGTKGVDPSPSVRVIRMVDPERNQTTLSYANK